MADTTKIETPTLEQAKEALQSATEFTQEKREALLATLKDKTEKATTNAEKVRINEVIVKIKQLSEGAQLHTGNMIEALKNSFTPDQKRIVADADSSIGEKIGAKAEDIAVSAKRVAGELVDQAPKGLDDMKQGIEKTAGAVANGDFSGAQKMAE